MKSLLAIALFLAVAAAPAEAKAPPSIQGDWTVKLSSVADTCGEFGMKLGTEPLTFRQKARKLEADIALVPTMKGTIEATGKFKVLTKRGRSPIEGLKGEFHMTGAVAGDTVKDVTLVARYYVGSQFKCEQSWSGTGERKKQ